MAFIPKSAIMIVYRVGITKYAGDITGEGARLNGGRWNHKSIACIYTSESRALAILEYSVNVNIEDIPRALSITTFEIPEVEIRHLKESDLPGNWKEVPAPSSTKDFGTGLLIASARAIIRIPSLVIPEEFNYLLNPAHIDYKRCKISGIKDLVYDVRIKLV